MIQENLEWTCPSEIAKKVQITHLSVTASQIYRAWTMMSEILWKRDLNQLTSVHTLLGEFDDDVDILRLLAIEGAIQVAWVMKDIVGLLQGKIVEVGCWMHARRKFYDARTSDPERAHAAIAWIGRLYGVESDARKHGHQVSCGETWSQEDAHRCHEEAICYQR